MICKNSFKDNALIFSAFLSGMWSVTISNFFGGYYCVVLAILVVLSSFLVYSVLDRELVKENKIVLIGISVLILFEFVFFVFNDIFGIDVYVKNDVGFLGMCVLISQLLSIGMIVYCLVDIVLSFTKKETIELVNDNEIDEENESKEEEEIEEKIEDEEKVEEIKRIPETKFQKDIPFMEENK